MNRSVSWKLHRTSPIEFHRRPRGSWNNGTRRMLMNHDQPHNWTFIWPSKSRCWVKLGSTATEEAPSIKWGAATVSNIVCRILSTTTRLSGEAVFRQVCDDSILKCRLSLSCEKRKTFDDEASLTLWRGQGSTTSTAVGGWGLLSVGWGTAVEN